MHSNVWNIDVEVFLSRPNFLCRNRGRIAVMICRLKSCLIHFKWKISSFCHLARNCGLSVRIPPYWGNKKSHEIIKILRFKKHIQNSDNILRKSNCTNTLESSKIPRNSTLFSLTRESHFNKSQIFLLETSSWQIKQSQYITHHRYSINWNSLKIPAVQNLSRDISQTIKGTAFDTHLLPLFTHADVSTWTLLFSVIFKCFFFLIFFRHWLLYDHHNLKATQLITEWLTFVEFLLIKSTSVSLYCARRSLYDRMAVACLSSICADNPDKF